MVSQNGSSQKKSSKKSQRPKTLLKQSSGQKKLDFAMDSQSPKKKKMSDQEIVDEAWNIADDSDFSNFDYNKPLEDEEDAAMEEIATSERARVEDEIQEEREHAHDPSIFIEMMADELDQLDLEEAMEELYD